MKPPYHIAIIKLYEIPFKSGYGSGYKLTSEMKIAKIGDKDNTLSMALVCVAGQISIFMESSVRQTCVIHEYK